MPAWPICALPLLAKPAQIICHKAQLCASASGLGWLGSLGASGAHCVKPHSASFILYKTHCVKPTTQVNLTKCKNVVRSLFHKGQGFRYKSTENIQKPQIIKRNSSTVRALSSPLFTTTPPQFTFYIQNFTFYISKSEIVNQKLFPISN
jgi:hypothetical protein